MNFNLLYPRRKSSNRKTVAFKPTACQFEIQIDLQCYSRKWTIKISMVQEWCWTELNCSKIHNWHQNWYVDLLIEPNWTKWHWKLLLCSWKRFWIRCPVVGSWSERFEFFLIKLRFSAKMWRLNDCETQISNKLWCIKYTLYLEHFSVLLSSIEIFHYVLFDCHFDFFCS